jgi:DNA gyrase subunit B
VERARRSTSKPDPQIFGKSGQFEPDRIRERLEATSYLHRGLKIVLRFEKGGEREEFHHPNGIADFLTKLVAQRQKPPIHPVAFTFERDGEGRVEVALPGPKPPTADQDFVNGIPTPRTAARTRRPAGGAIKALRGYIDAHELTPKRPQDHPRGHPRGR